MLDKFSREINYLRVSITDRCNLHCEYCRPKEGISLKGHEDILRYEEIIRVVSIAVKMGLIKVRVTGGEPLVRRGFIHFIEGLNKIGGLQDISLTTNGILLAQFARQIFEAGIHRINISLDSLNKDKYFRITRGGNLDDVMRGIARAEEAGFAPIKINTVAIKDFNDDEVLDFARLAADKPFQVRFIELMPVGKETDPGYSGNFIPAAGVIEKIKREFELFSYNAKQVLLACCINRSPSTIEDISVITGLKRDIVIGAVEEIKRLFLLPKPTIIKEAPRFDVNINTRSVVIDLLPENWYTENVRNLVK